MKLTLSLMLFSMLGGITLVQAQSTQATFNGNSATGFGGVIGGGTLMISNNATGNVAFTLTRGVGGLNDAFVLYFDSVSGGFSGTGSFNDQGDSLRRAISGASGGNTGPDANTRSIFNFAPGFAADYALAMNNGFAGLWQLATGGDNSLSFVTSANLSPTGSGTSSTYSFSFNVSNLGMTANSGAQFSFVGTYLNADNSFRSNEGFGFTAPGANPGAGGIGAYPTTTASGSFSFTTIPEPSSSVLLILGTTGLLALRRVRKH